ncbi:MAG: hypothetical protein WA326_00040 [Nitrososphaeraceae archaeon]
MNKEKITLNTMRLQVRRVYILFQAMTSKVITKGISVTSGSLKEIEVILIN